MQRRIHVLAIAIIAMFSTIAHAREGDCVYSLGKGLTAYCSFVTAPEGTKRFLEVIYNPQMAITSCVDNTTLPFSFSTDMIGKNNLVLVGTHTVNFYQCSAADCENKKSLGASTFNVAADKTVKPNKFNIVLEGTFGEDCSTSTFNPNNTAMIIPKTDCKKSPYCATLNLPNNINRFIKVVSDKQIAFTYCINNMSAVAIGSDATAGSHEYTFYQCDTLACDKARLLKKEVISVSAGGKFDPNKANLDLDPAFGENCTINNQ